ncbi:MAG TPA: acyl-CoA thioesterase [Gammaproteobacteria bacterium]|nr:acyl-CoA thioesterase [Gammaproteobacteria bacterium]
MSASYTKTLEVRWADLDPNGHVRHSAYADYGAQARIAYLTEHGFGPTQFQKLRIGPILFREDLKYFREIHANERVTITVEVSGLSPNRKHWRFRHRILRGDGELACIIDCQGTWFDLTARKVISAPADLNSVMEHMPRSQDFTEFEPKQEG